MRGLDGAASPSKIVAAHVHAGLLWSGAACVEPFGMERRSSWQKFSASANAGGSAGSLNALSATSANVASNKATTATVRARNSLASELSSAASAGWATRCSPATRKVRRQNSSCACGRAANAGGQRIPEHRRSAATSAERAEHSCQRMVFYMYNYLCTCAYTDR